MKGFRRIAISLAVISITLLISFGGLANTMVSAATATPTYPNWSASSYNFQNTNNDPQDVINVNNVADLVPTWIYEVPVNPFSIPGAPPALGIEAQELVVDGIDYVATPYNAIIALNTVTDNVDWQYQINMTQFEGEKWWSGAYVISGISDYNQTIYVTASNTAIYAINALNGSLDWTIPPIAANIPGNTGTYYGEKAPILVGDNLIVRASTTDYGGRGFVAAYNIDTKKLVWQWYSVPSATTPDPDWDSQDMVTLANGTTVNYGQPQGNITPYTGDWGTTNQSVSLIGGGAAWGLIAVNNKTGVIYFSTGHPSDGYDASLRPGPNLFTDCIVALNSTNGKMIWYYQMTSHDITEHEGGWSDSLSTITLSNGTSVQVVIQAAKNNEIYVLNAATGKPVYTPITVGPKSSNNWNDGLTATANLTASQALFGSKDICPGPDGGIEMAPAIDGNMLYVVTQNACGLMSYAAGAYPYKGQNINGYIYTDDPAAPENGTVYAINLANGQPVWHQNLPDRYQGSSAVISGGVLYVIDRAGILYMFDAATGVVLKSFSLGGIGAAGVSIAYNSDGAMTLFAPAGGGSNLGAGATPGVVVAYNLPAGTATTSGQSLDQPVIIVLGVVVVILVMYTLLRRRTPTQSRAKPPRTRAL